MSDDVKHAVIESVQKHLTNAGFNAFITDKTSICVIIVGPKFTIRMYAYDDSIHAKAYPCDLIGKTYSRITHFEFADPDLMSNVVKYAKSLYERH